MIRKNNNMYPPIGGLRNYREGYQDGRKRGKENVTEILDKIEEEVSKVNEELDGYDPDSLSTLFCRTLEIVEKYKKEVNE